MTALSGGLVYEFTQEEQDYGLVVVNSNGSVSLRTDYDNLQSQYNKLDKNLIEATNPSSTGIKAPACASSLIMAQQFSKNFTIPAVCSDCQSLINSGISNPLNGKIMDVSSTTPKQQVYGSNGALVQGLQLNKQSNNGVNGPGGQSTTPSTTASGGAAQPSASKKAAASKLQGGLFMAVTLGALALFI
jgi:hypothetical protein